MANTPFVRPQRLVFAIAVGVSLGVMAVYSTTRQSPAAATRRSGDPCLTFIRATTGSDAAAAWSNFGDCPAAPRDPDRETLVVDLRYGLVLYYKTEALLSTLPFPFTIVQRNQDDRSRAFGTGGTNTYDMALVGDPLSWVDLVRAGGGNIHYLLTQPTVFHTKANGSFRDTTLHWTGRDWRLRRDDNIELRFPESRRATRLEQAALLGMQGASEEPLLTIDRDAQGNILRLNASGGQVAFDHDEQDRMTAITTADGRALLRFSYDVGGCLASRSGGDGEFAFEHDHGHGSCQLHRGSHNGVTSFEAEYDDRDRVIRITDPAGRIYAISYETDSAGTVVAAELSDDAGPLRHIVFDKSGYSFLRSAAARQP